MHNRVFKIVVWVTLAAMLFTTVLMSVSAFLS
ncbi:stressosome-associated protein Prli42 [Cohnella sp. CFH 77786]|nr:stressosome-associated protein Prli42 [Cohnella sp. CFH 77786]MBW5446740.1 stressosome-associated protein Prli42 [Cohnella sp. CFH 77786]